MMQIVQALGYERFYNYLELFGVTEKTGIDLPGEEDPLIQNVDEAGPVGLATMAFGQGLSVTPIQMVSAIGAIAYDGKLMVPRVVKGLADNEGNMVEEFAPKIKRQVISENTAAEVRDILQEVSEKQASSVARIPGYNIGVKTGTTQKLVYGEYSDSASIGSMVIIAPIEDPQFVAIVLCDTPRVGYYGISTAGPVVNEISEEVLRYLNIKPDYTENELEKMNSQRLTVADYTGWTLADVKASLELQGLKSNIGVLRGDEPEEPEDTDAETDADADIDADTDGADSTAHPEGDVDDHKNGSVRPENYLVVNDLPKDLKVVDQYPKPGMNVAPNGTVFLYWE
jgi:stage V sporulation protein D (sporulation-specific penicillin-binding protein)